MPAIPQIDDIDCLDWWAVAAYKPDEYCRDLGRAGVFHFRPWEWAKRKDRPDQPSQTYRRFQFLNWVFVFTGHRSQLHMAAIRPGPESIESIHRQSGDRERLYRLMLLQTLEQPIIRTSKLQLGCVVEVKRHSAFRGYRGPVSAIRDTRVVVAILEDAAGFSVDSGGILGRSTVELSIDDVEIVDANQADIAAARLAAGDQKRRVKLRAAERVMR